MKELLNILEQIVANPAPRRPHARRKLAQAERNYMRLSHGQRRRNRHRLRKWERTLTYWFDRIYLKLK